MKFNIKNILVALATSVVFTACIGDLDTYPLNKTDVTSETAYGADEAGYVAGLTKLYFNFLNTSDLNVKDGGASELIRAFWSTQEATADACKVAWKNDEWVRNLNGNTWKSEQNDATYAVYCRTLQGVAYVNEYLRQTSADKLQLRGVSEELAAKIDGFRAEARFLRAYFYWMAFDVFGAVPFTTEDSPFGGDFVPSQKSRAEVFSYVVRELEELAGENSAMPAAQSNYPRADKGSCLGLLARLYLNAEVYTKSVENPNGTAMWEEAKATCEKIYALGYSLCDKYEDLFRGDNGQNLAARNEFLFAADYDAESTQSYGGTSYLTFASGAANDDFTRLFGVNNGWGGTRVPYTYVSKFFNVSAQNYETGNYNVKDERGKLFFIKGREENIEDEEDLYSFLNGWTCVKFNNHPHGVNPDGIHEVVDKEEQDAEGNTVIVKDTVYYWQTAANKSYSDIDFPLIRLGEIHLIYAEACMELGETATALPKLAELAERAGVVAPTAAQVENVSGADHWLMAERARELMWEGHRRTDLVRYGLYTGDTYLWTYKGGSPQGQAFEDHMYIFPIPASEMASNPMLVQNEGYL